MHSELKTSAVEQSSTQVSHICLLKVRETMELFHLYGLVFMVLVVKSEHIGE